MRPDIPTALHKHVTALEKLFTINASEVATYNPHARERAA
jgi:hypothetical protein